MSNTEQMELTSADGAAARPRQGAGGSRVEEAFAEAERRAAELVKQLAGIKTGVTAAHRASRTGDVRALSRAVQATRAALRRTEPELDALNAVLAHDFAEDLRSGAWAEEVVAAAESGNLRGVRIVHGSIMSFPIVVGALPEKLAVRYGKKPSQEIRPSKVAERLQSLRTKRGTSGRPAARRLIDAIERAFVELTRGSYSRGVPIRDVYDRLTLLPEQKAEYTELDFVVDLYLLERQGVLESSNRRTLSFPASTSARGGRNVIRIATEDGEERIYSSLRFD